MTASPAKPATSTNSAATVKRPATTTKRPGTTTKAPAATTTKAPRRRRPRLRGVTAIREALRANQTPVFFVGATPYNLLGLERWVGGLGFISYYDPFDGSHPLVFSPDDRSSAELSSTVEITNHLLRHPQVQAQLAQGGRTPKITAVFADLETERLCAELGYELIMPSVAERERLASVITAVDELDGAAGQLITAAAVVTRDGTVVGPYLTPLVGHSALTPDPYAWCGNEIFPGVVTGEHRAAIADQVRDLGDRLREDGFRGYLEVHAQVDAATGSVSLVGLTPGIGAAAALTTGSAGAYADLPPFALHLSEHLGLDFELDVAEVNHRWDGLAAVDTRSQMIIRTADRAPELIIEAPASGRYVLDELGQAHLRQFALDTHELTDESEFFFLRIAGPGDHRWTGSDLGIVITKGRLQIGSEDRTGAADPVLVPPVLTPRAQAMIDAVCRLYVAVPAYAVEAAW